MAIVVRTNGHVESVSPLNGTDFLMEEIKTLIGMPRSQHIQIVSIDQGQKILVCNENAEQRNLGLNKLANLKFNGQISGSIVGDVLICEVGEIK